MRWGLVFVVLMVLGRAGEARADVISVTTTVDEFGSGAGCSLREAITAANTDAAFGGCPAGNGVDTIVVPAGTYTLTIPGAGDDTNATGDLDVLASVTITGAGAASTIVDGGALDRVLDVASGITVAVSGLTLRNGAVTGDIGGCLFAGATLTLSDVVMTGCTALDGGGATFNGPSNTVTGCTFSGNTASGNGGAVRVAVGGTATIAASTISGNTAPTGSALLNLDTLTLANVTVSGNTATGATGGAIYNTGVLKLRNVTIAGNTATTANSGGLTNNDALGTTTARNSIIANNTSATPADADCDGTLTSEGYNLVQNTAGCTFAGDTTGNVTGQDPVLGTLGDNGGSTQTQTLLVGSPALDAGNPGVPGSGGTTCEATDQIGTTRPVGAACDMGAVEAPSGGATTTTTSTTSSTSTTSTSTTESTTSTTETTTTTSTSSTSTSESTTSTSSTSTSTTESTTSTTSTSSSSTSSTSTTASTTSTTDTSTSTSLATTTSTTASTSSTTESTTSTSSTSTTSTSSSTTSTSSTTTSTSSTTSTTLAPVCNAGTTISKAVISVTKLGAPLGNERVAFKGTLDFQLGQPSTFDPATEGAQVLIEDLASGSAVGAFDLTHLTTPIPAGAPGTGCAPKDGWKKKAYRNVSNALDPPTCPAGSAQGLTNLVFVDARAKGKGIRFTMKARNATLDLNAGPLQGTIVLGASANDSLAGRCGVVTFTPTRCKRKGATLTCK